MNDIDSVTRRDLYRAAVGPKKEDYYVPLFLRFDEPGASLTSWNWPALFVAPFWLLYRRMYGYALACFFLLPLALFLLSMLATAVLGERTGNVVYWLASIAANYVLMPMFANALYHRHVKKRIGRKMQTGAATEQLISELERGPHTSHVAWVVVPVAIVPILGIMAAIAIPAYQDYTIRTQVTEGLHLASGIKAQVAETYAQNRSWPESIAAMGYKEPISGQYVAEISVDSGVIAIHYGMRANPKIADQVLTLRPSLTREGEVVWSCGYAEGRGSEPQNAASGPTTVPARYLPATCRGR